MSKSETRVADSEDDDPIAVLATRIAEGHAFAKHSSEFGSISREDFAAKIQQTIRDPSVIMELERGRMLYWNDDGDFVVVTSPKDVDGGTAFRSRTDRAYLDTVE